MARYAELVRACPHNLLSPRGLEELETRHIPESLIFARDLPRVDGEVVDVGPGAGLPGMVIAIVRPDLSLTMVEATRKKAQFLEETAAELDVDVTVVHGRIEELARDRFAGTFTLATARAVAPLDRLVGWVVPALTPGGQLWAIKGERWAEELEDARAVLEDSGAQVVRTPAVSTEQPDPVAPSGPTVVIVSRAPTH